MTHKTRTDSRKASNRSAIARYIASGTTCRGHGCIGLELEHIIVRKVTHAPVSYSEPGGICDVLRALAPFYDTMTVKDGRLIGLVKDDSNITIEPAGQVEISIAPQTDLAQIARIYREFRSNFDTVLDRLDLDALTLGYHPTARAEELALIPKARYRIMDAHFESTGRFGKAMMRGSASVQASIDFSDEADAIRKLRLASALGPLLAFVCDNAPFFEAGVTRPRMARTQIWGDVDPLRSMVVPGLFDKPGYSFADYADYVMSRPPMLVEEDGKTIDTGCATSDEIYEDVELDIRQIEHLLSMFFPDVRLKHYIEIRVADSLPIEYSLAYAALVKGLFYSHRNLDALAQELQGVHDADIPEAKQELMEHGYAATVYGRPAYQWLDELIVYAWRGLVPDERCFLEPLCKLVERRTTLFDESFSANPDLGLAKLGEAWISQTQALGGDLEGRRQAWDAMQASTAVYHDEVIAFGYVPKLLSPATIASFDSIAQTTHRILCKVIDAYVADKDYRALFGFDPRLDELILADAGYAQELPICRIDFFLDEEGSPSARGEQPFMFCEFNTDGTSAMNEDRAVAAALLQTPTCSHLADSYDIAAQSLFDPWVRRMMALVHEYDPSIADPHVAIVDFPGSGTPYEFEEFKRRFAAHGVRCSIYDIRELAYDGTCLRGPDGIAIDAIYRRAVTPEVMEHFDELHAFIDAVRDGKVCLIGSFKTQVPHCKKISEILHAPETHDLLEDDEIAFIEAHVPFTAMLLPSCAVLDSVLDDKDSWIIKPNDGYASQGVYAGRNHSAEAWRQIIEEHLDGGYVVQSYCRQYESPNSKVSAPSGDVEALTPYNNLIGLYIYDGHFAGVYTRAGKGAIIVGSQGGMTLASLLARPRRK